MRFGHSEHHLFRPILAYPGTWGAAAGLILALAALIWRSPPTPAAGDLLRWALIGGFAITAAMAGVEGWSLASEFPLFATAYIFAAVTSAVALVILWRGGPLAPVWQVSATAGRVFVGATFSAFALMGLGCTGSLVAGCNTACTVIKLGVVPVGCVALWRGKCDARLTMAGTWLLGLALLPSCICDNPPNAVFMDGFGWGISPACYLAAFMAALLGISASFGPATRLFAVAQAGLLAVVSVFAVGHQIFHWPW